MVWVDNLMKAVAAPASEPVNVTTTRLTRDTSNAQKLAALRDAVYLMSARTLQRSRLLLIPSHDVIEAFQQNGATYWVVNTLLDRLSN